MPPGWGRARRGHDEHNVLHEQAVVWVAGSLVHTLLPGRQRVKHVPVRSPQPCAESFLQEGYKA